MTGLVLQPCVQRKGWNKIFSCLVILIFTFLSCQAKPLVTNPERGDGFGAQFQTIIYSVIWAELNDSDFVYTPFKAVEHNYDNDPEFIAKKEWLINFENNFAINRSDALRLDMMQIIYFFEQNLEMCAHSLSLNKIKEIFRANKTRNHYFNDEHFHIAIHIRRFNSQDNRIDGTNTPDAVFLNIIDHMRMIYAAQSPLFHIYSQGNIQNFLKFSGTDIILHLNESVEATFSSLVLADALVTSRSSFSYAAGILSEGSVYYMPFWHPPLPSWISVNELLK